MIPRISDRDAFTVSKESGSAYQRPETYADITLPKNSPMGPLLGGIGFFIAFGLVWHIGWMVVLSTLAAVVTIIAHGFTRNTTRIIPAWQVRQEHHRWLDVVAAAMAITRADECKPANQGLAYAPRDGASV